MDKNIKLYSSYADLPFFVIKSENVKRRTSESYGLAVRCTTTGRQLMVRSQETSAFVLFFRGVYHLWKVPQLVAQMTSSEYKQLTDCLSDFSLYRQIFLKVSGPNHNALVEKYAYQRLQDAAKIIQACPCPTLQETTFSCCRGQKNKGESPLDCAYREFFEETGVQLREIPHRFTKEQYENKMVTASGLNYTSSIFVIEVDEEFNIPLAKHDQLEVCEVCWI